VEGSCIDGIGGYVSGVIEDSGVSLLSRPVLEEEIITEKDFQEHGNKGIMICQIKRQKRSRDWNQEGESQRERR